MKWFLPMVILPVWIYTASFAKYNWSSKNRMAAAGSILLLLASIVLPLYLLVFQ